MDVGSRVTVLSIPDSKGTIRFSGATAFSIGKWIGVELDDGGGKNDGSVAGKRYFTCAPGHGVFAKPNGVKLLGSTPTEPSTPRSRPGLASSRPPMSARASTNASTPRTVNASPAPIMSRPPSTTSRPPSTASRAMSREQSGTSVASSSLSRRSSLVPKDAAPRSTPGLRSPELLPPSPEPAPSTPSPLLRGAPSPDLMPPPALPSQPQLADPFSLRSKGDSVSTREATVSVREHDELQSRLRILERARTEDRERLKELERLKEEERSWKDVKTRLQGKLVEMQAELKTLRVQAKEVAIERDAAQTRYADLADDVEMATLDKEVAEEKVDALEATVSALKERVAELEVETDVLRDGADRTETLSMSTSDTVVPPSLQVVQLEKQNERLKDALARLRDLTAEAETESRRRIADLEKELDLTAELQTSFDAVAERADLAEAQVEEMKQQLDDAIGSEDMLIQLTDRNLSLSEKVEEMHAAMEDLEALKELADELEDNHVETEKQMQEELDAKDAILRDQRRRGDELEETVLDYESTIGQFRELVLSLQSDLEQVREQQQAQQVESQSLTSQSQAMLNLNMKLQSTVIKTQVKTIDLELRRLDALQAAERLEIIRGDSDAVDALLFFERLAAKAELISTGLAQHHNVAESLGTIVTETLVSVCETRGRLARFSVLTRRFAANLRRCSTETFIAMGGLYHELSGIEKRIDGFVEAMRREELKVGDCGREVDKFIAQAAHLAEMHLGESGLDFGEQQWGVAVSLDLDFDTVVAGVGYTKQTLAVLAKEPTTVLETEDANLPTNMYEPLQMLIDQSRTAQSIARKILRRINDLVKKSAYLSPTVADPLAQVSRSVQLLAAAAVKMADLMGRYASDIRLTHSALALATLQGLIDEATADLHLKSANILAALDTDLALAVSRLSAGLNAVLDSDQVINSSHTPPWTERVAEISRNAAINIDAEQRAHRLNEELRDLRREMRVREQSMQESSVKIELMNRRMEAVKKQADSIGDLEAELAKARKQEQAYEEAVAALQKDLDNAERELVKFKSGPAPPASASDATGDATETVAFTGSLETAHLVAQVEALRGAVRFIRRENAFLRCQPLSLPALPTATPAPPSDSMRQLREEHRKLLKDVIHLASTPTIVDLCAATKTMTEPPKPFGWTPMATKPERQLAARQDQARTLSQRLDRLKLAMVELPRMASVGA